MTRTRTEIWASIATVVGLATSIAIALTASPAHSQSWVQPQDQETCTSQPNIAWCNGTSTTLPARFQPKVRTQGIVAVRQIERNIRGEFTLTDMGDQRDLWRSYVDNGSAHDDCTGLASTVVDALAREGYKTARVLVITRFRGRPDHMIGLVTLPNGQKWVVGDTLRNEPYPFADANYTATAISWTQPNAQWTQP